MLQKRLIILITSLKSLIYHYDKLFLISKITINIVSILVTIKRKHLTILNQTIMNKLVLILLLFSISFVSAQQSKIVLKTNFQGDITQGSIEDLISKIQEGHTLRLGWSLDFDNDNIPDLEHWVEAEFITIMNGHVYNQIKTIHQQMPLPANVELSSNGNTWQAIISTKGVMQHQYSFETPPQIGGVNGKEISEAQQKEILENLLKIQEDKVATVWALSSL